MKMLWIVISLVIVSSGIVSGKELKAKVAGPGVIDGDTFDTDQGRVRVLNINTPELGTNPGKYAYYYARKILSGKEVALIEEPNHGGDKYGRKLYHVILPDGSNYAELMIRRGHSRYWLKYGRSALFDDLYQKAEGYAHEHCLGVWKKICRSETKK